MASSRTMEYQGVKFQSSWSPDPDEKSVMVLSKEGAEANYAVRIEQGESGPKLTLLTKQATDKGDLAWMPSKTQCVGDPEKVIKEAEYRDTRIGKSWKLDTDKGVLVHRGGIFAARSVLDEKGRNTGKLELLTKQGPEGKKEWRPAKNPCVGTPEHVFQQTTHRQLTMDRIYSFSKKPIGYVKGKDSQGNMIFKHPGNRHAVRFHSLAEDGKTAKLEVLTTQFNKEEKRFEWMPAKKPFIGPAQDAYSEIGNREYGLAKRKMEEAQGMGKKTGKADEPPAVDKAQDGPEYNLPPGIPLARVRDQANGTRLEAEHAKVLAERAEKTPAKAQEPKKEAPAKKPPTPAKAKAAPKKGRGM